MKLQITNPLLQAVLVFVPPMLVPWALAAWAVSAIFQITFWHAVVYLVAIAVIGLSFVAVELTARGRA